MGYSETRFDPEPGPSPLSGKRAKIPQRKLLYGVSTAMGMIEEFRVTGEVGLSSRVPPPARSSRFRQRE